MIGWISLHRKLQDNWLWEDKPFSKGQAWIDLLLMVNHEDKTILLGTELIEVKRGSRITSIRQLCDRWGWSNTKVRNFLNLLEKDGMLVVKSDTKKTTVTIVNYNDYQEPSDTKNDTETTDERQSSDTKTSRKHTNNNDNNDNNDNKIYGPVINYLNQKCSTSYKSSTKKTKILIDARINEGFTLEDFKKVIDIKSAEWLNTDMAKYLRPETLFGTKFEGYLNQGEPVKPKPQSKPNKFNDNMIKHDDNIDLEALAEKRRQERRKG